MPYEPEMEEEGAPEEAESPPEGEKKDYTEEEMMDYLANEAGSAEEFKSILDEHGWELRKAEGPAEDFDSIEKELGMHSSPPKLSVIRLSSARKALNQSGKRK